MFKKHVEKYNDYKKEEMKMKHMKIIILLSALVIVCLGFKPANSNNKHIFGNTEKEYRLSTSFNYYPQEKDTSKWMAPAEADNLINPVEVNEETLAEGKMIYRVNCRSCHGRLGDGQGVEAADLNTKVNDFTISEFLKQTDGAIFWKISEGRIMKEKNAQGKDDMEAFKDDLEEEEIWLLVNYIKTFSIEEDK